MSDQRVGLKIDRPARDRVVAAAEAAYPEECCGVLLGTTSGSSAIISEAIAVRNTAADRRCRFEIAPEEILAATRSARDRGLEIVGYYHSHPDGRAIPSARDLSAAWPATSYLILAVEKGRARELRSWVVAECGEVFAEQPIAVDVGRGAERSATEVMAR